MSENTTYRIDEAIIHRFNARVPNGCCMVDGIGGIGTVIVNHRVPLGREDHNPLNIRSIGWGIRILGMEGFIADTMILNPVQDREIQAWANQTENEIAVDLVNLIKSFITVLVNDVQPAGQVLMVDTRAYEKFDDDRKYDALAMLYKGLIEYE